ncbi:MULTISPECIES: CshA/CshB family fibrillar adhesin-related protein [Sphingobacterium]|uniref:CshA/CshB family fibrillar adhesin-related protein n=1 Tax=Sphingobacterium TaxID=28453 RepID=UPI0013DD4771|nr:MULTISPECIES: CshA/CshB family fibrillar adhesin-related protein [unclassified Sphingobacterium]
MTNRSFLLCMILIFSSSAEVVRAQCYENSTVKAAFATGGTSPNKEKVLWLNWGGQGDANSPYGKTDEALAIGAVSRASIDLGEGKYLCIEAKIISIENVSGNDADERAIQSYIPGTYTGDGVTSGDFLDILYNIGGGRTGDNESQNKMVSGIRNTKSGGGAKITISCKAKIGDIPIRLPGMVVADAESLAGYMNSNGDPNREYIYAEAYGSWHVVEVQKNSKEAAYNIRKEINSNGTQTIKFLGGNDKKTGAVAFLAFSEQAYNKSGTIPDLGVSFTATLKGGGLTALALGLLNPAADLGDAPASYGSPIHLLQNLTFSEDNISPVLAGAENKEKVKATVNINTDEYRAGELKLTKGSYLGTAPPDEDSGAMFSKDALGDDNSPTTSLLLNEEDAWPEEYKRFSYKQYYMPGNKISARIPYKGAKAGSRIAGWIDFDLNGKFDDSERAMADIGNDGDGVAELNWVVPALRRPYSTYVRLRYFDVSEQETTSPVDNVNFGEVEDHRIYILGPSVVNPTIPSKIKR